MNQQDDHEGNPMATDKPRLTRLLAGIAGLALLAGACSDDTDPTTRSGGGEVTLGPNEITLTQGLATFDDCDALLTHLRTEGAERVGPYGLNNDIWYGPVMARGGVVTLDGVDVGTDDVAAEESSSGSGAPVGVTAAQDGDSAGEGVNFSGTNNQEQGVDEPDIVKTDGDRILAITNGTFTYIDANDGEPIVRGSLHIGDGATDMVVSGDRVLVFGSSYGWIGGPIPGPVPLPAIEGDAVGGAPDVDEPVAQPAAEEEADEAGPTSGDKPTVDEAPAAEETELLVAEDELFPTEPYWNGPESRIVQLDISNPDRPVELGELRIEGRHLSARLIGGTARIAIQSDVATLPFVYPSNGNSEGRAEEFNRQVVNESTIGDWLPDFQHMVGGEVRTEGQLSPCTDVHAPIEFAGFGSLSVLSIDLDGSLDDVRSSSVLAAGDTVYASTDTMWLATTMWVDWGALDEAAIVERQRSFSTQIHGFDITGTKADYLASGNVRGHMLNQFSMSEHDGILRVATTDGPAWGADAESESFISTFDVDGTELRPLGQVGDMGKGERIFSVRFVGETAYVVTFRQTDPFYTVDLSDPADPRVLGELKINGYSGQLHPIGENRILGIGQDATSEGVATGAKVTVFDVTDLSEPTALDSWTLPDSWTDAEWNHLAFLWWAPENLAVLPISSWREQFWGAVAFRVDPDTGTITEAGRISHEPDPDDVVGTTDCRVIDPDQLEDYRGGRGDLAGLAEEAFWISQDGGQVQLCDEGATGAAGLWCDRLDWIDTGEIGVDGTLEICWPQGPQGDPIQRTLVTGGDTLWSLSSTRLQANDLDSLEAGSHVSLR